MTKIVRKVRPADYWRIGEHESWFSDMSAKGLHLHKMGTHFAHFKKGEPKRMEYRIEVTKSKGISDEQVKMYEESGWDYVTSYQLFHVFSSLEEDHAPELHTDPMEQSFTLNQLNNRLILALIAIVLGFALLVGMLAAFWFLGRTPVLRLVEGLVIQQIIASFLIFYLLYFTTRAMISIHALRRNLKEGKSINHHAPWNKSLRKSTAFSILFLFVSLMSALLPFYQIYKMDTWTLPEDDSGLPFVRLADIERNPKLVRDSYYIDNTDFANRYSFNWSVIAPEQYVTNESGIIEELKWQDESGIYAPRLSTEVYKLRLNSLVKPLISDLIKWHSFGDESEPFVEIKHPDFDQLIVHEDAETKQLFASKGKVVMYVRYHGYAETDHLIEKVAEKNILLPAK